MHPMLSAFICFLQVLERRAYTPNCCVLRMLHPLILPYCCFTDTQAILAIGLISSVMLPQVLPLRHWTVAVKEDFQKIVVMSLVTPCTGILFVDSMMHYGVPLKRCSSDRYFSIQPNLPRSLWKCLMWMRVA